MLKQGLNYVKSHIKEAAAQAHPESRKHIHGPLRSCSARPSPQAKQGWVLKQGRLNHAKSRNREHGRGGCLSKG